MNIRKLRRRATPRLLERYLALLPRIEKQGEFQRVLVRTRATAAILGVNIAERLADIAAPHG